MLLQQFVRIYKLYVLGKMGIFQLHVKVGKHKSQTFAYVLIQIYSK